MSGNRNTDYILISNLLRLVECTKETVIIAAIGILASAFFAFFRPQIICRLTDQGLESKDFRLVLAWCVVLLVITLFDHANNILQIKIFTNISNKFTKRLYLESLNRILMAPCELSKNRTASELVSTICKDVEKTSILLDRNMLTTIIGIFQIIGGLAGLFALNWQIALVIVCIIPVKHALIMSLATQRSAFARALLRNIQTFSEWFGDQINGIVEIKLWDLYASRKNIFEKQYKDIADINAKLEMWDGIESTVRCIIDQIIEVIIYIYCGLLVCSNKMSLGVLLAVIAYSMNVTAPMDIITNIPYLWAKIKPSAERLSALFAWPAEDEYCTCMKNDNYDLTLNKVSFGYNEEKRVLKNISITIPYGSKVAIIGENGSGKTTLVNIILGIIKANTGTLSIGEQNIKDLGLKKWRECFAVVNQSLFLFKGTISENICMNEFIDSEELDRLINNSGFNGICPDSLDFYSQVLLENGKDLSGGERQKIAILRALYKQSKIIILDESFSCLDEESRAIIRNALFSPTFHKTVILISHYDEDIADVEEIYKLRDGHIEKISA